MVEYKTYYDEKFVQRLRSLFGGMFYDSNSGMSISVEIDPYDNSLKKLSIESVRVGASYTYEKVEQNPNKLEKILEGERIRMIELD